MTEPTVIPVVWEPKQQLERALNVAEQWHLKGKDDVGLRHLMSVVRRVLPLMEQ